MDLHPLVPRSKSRNATKPFHGFFMALRLPPDRRLTSPILCGADLAVPDTTETPMATNVTGLFSYVN
ncbi:hypothetical protein DPMN_081377 [Dreissena polymorpha]|uniref:Uncharacterized protein n=1 Tax=Dreissena polymorpha TaxID=45954 RepID=A0A9D4BHP8_DREPO|nr:hypothetical protein DPMN_081377 [Dreissena polymorpha]